ncbi:MAG TPA: hypothetical protein VK524_29355, partial [Polyangiaceae bacterium]|nr:hypothetical protein [Polyangiaceae bacterium]
DDLEPMKRAVRVVFDRDSADAFQIVPNDTDYVRIGDFTGYRRENDAHLNDVRIRLSQKRLRVSVDNRELMNTELPHALDWSEGHVIFQQFAYNPHKDCPGNAFDCEKNTVNWGYMGFDGASPDVNAVGTNQSKIVWVHALRDRTTPDTQTVEADHPTGGKGLVRFSAIGHNDKGGLSQYRINQGAWVDLHETDRCWAWRTFTVPATVLRGRNTIDFRSNSTVDGCFGDTDQSLAIHRVDFEVPAAPP